MGFLNTNPSWVNPGILTPQYPGKYTQPPITGHYVGLQNTVDGQNSVQINNAGVTHVWAPLYAGQGLGAPLTLAGMFNSGPFGSSNPDTAAINAYADISELVNNMISTDEFFEGTYPIYDNFYGISDQFYARRKSRATSAGYTIKDFGSYGFSDAFQHPGYYHDGLPQPMSAYMLSLLEPDIVDKLQPGKLKAFLQTSKNYRSGSVCGLYYSMELLPRLGEIICSLFNHAMYVYGNGSHDVLAFFWNHMQDNLYFIDDWINSKPTIRPDGSLINDFPAMPYELMKIFVLITSLLFPARYLWGGLGTIEPNEDSGSCAMDAFVIGNQIRFTTLQDYIADSDGELYVCDYIADGSTFSSTTPERRISRKGSPAFLNRYFNECAAQRRGFCIVIRSSPKVFIYINPFRGPHQLQTIVAKDQGTNYTIGAAPGMTANIWSTDFP